MSSVELLPENKGPTKSMLTTKVDTDIPTHSKFILHINLTSTIDFFHTETKETNHQTDNLHKQKLYNYHD